MAATDVDIITDLSFNDTTFKLVETFDDGSRMVEASIILSRVPDDLVMAFSIVKGGITFEDGTLTMTVTAADFDEFGRFRYRLIVAPDVNGSACHRYSFSQGGIQL